MGDSSKNAALLLVDPARIRFQHARIRPVFSGCGRTLTETLDSIRAGLLQPSDLPPIQVLIGPETGDGPWYFSLNNRRLWVLKRCREEGLLSCSNNQIHVRVRAAKSQSEQKRYTLENCALEAKLMRHHPDDGDQKNNDQSDFLSCVSGDGRCPPNDQRTTKARTAGRTQLKQQRLSITQNETKSMAIVDNDSNNDNGNDSDDSDGSDDGPVTKNRFGALSA